MKENGPASSTKMTVRVLALLVCVVTVAMAAEIPDPQTNCTTRAECSFVGLCDTTRNHCICPDNRATITLEEQCGYHRKAQITAFLLQLFLGTLGAGSIYLGNWVMFGILLGGFALTCVCTMCCALAMRDSSEISSIQSAIRCLICFIMLGLFIGWVVILILIANNDLKDSNDVFPTPW